MGRPNDASSHAAMSQDPDPHLGSATHARADAQSDDLLESIRHATIEQALERLSARAGGLSSEEATRRQATYGKNLIESGKRRSPILAFLSNFTHLMAILLWVAGTIAFVAGLPELGIAVWLVNIINGVFSFWQEARASQATEALKKMLPAYTDVIRDGQEQKVLAEDLVPGDIMLLAEGDRISADARVIASSDLQVNQSTLNGESNPSRKVADAVLEEGLSPAEIPNLVFAGTSVSEGNGRAVVMRIGMDTEFGKIASLTQNMQEAPSPLQRDLDRLTKQVTVFAMCMGLIFFALSMFVVREPFASSFIFALGMVVAFIPEGLLPTVTLSLAMAVQRMSKRNALVKKLNSVEALGSTSVICTDKTGTLTQNEMTVNHLWTATREYDLTGVGYAPVGTIESEGTAYRAVDDPDLELLLEGGLLCGNARLRAPEEDGQRYEVYGDPTEACLIVSAQKGGIDPAELERRMPRVKELPFESRRKRMTTVHALEDPIDGAVRVAFTKGAPNEVVRLADTVRIDGQTVPMTDELRARIMAANDGYAADGLRVLAVAYRPLGAQAAREGVPASLSAYTPETVECHLTFVGLEVMMDPPRPEVAAAVAECRRAGIRIVMITGDYGLTAASIARRIGIVDGDDLSVISGFELAHMDDAELKRRLAGQVVFARMAPEQKLRVVSALQEMGEVVAVTGDGVNDAPALKKADIDRRQLRLDRRRDRGGTRRLQQYPQVPAVHPELQRAGSGAQCGVPALGRSGPAAPDHHADPHHRPGHRYAAGTRSGHRTARADRHGPAAARSERAAAQPPRAGQGLPVVRPHGIGRRHGRVLPGQRAQRLARRPAGGPGRRGRPGLHPGDDHDARRHRLRPDRPGHELPHREDLRVQGRPVLQPQDLDRHRLRGRAHRVPHDVPAAARRVQHRPARMAGLRLPVLHPAGGHRHRGGAQGVAAPPRCRAREAR